MSQRLGAQADGGDGDDGIETCNESAVVSEGVVGLHCPAPGSLGDKVV